MSDTQRADSWLRAVPERVGNYLAGFADGEGSFVVSLVKRQDYVLGWKVVMIFNVSQRDKTVLALFKRYMGCGRFQYRKDGVWYYIVSSPRAIQERVVPFFTRFAFFSSTKKKNFSIFRRVTKMMDEHQQYTQEGLQHIISLREQLNEGKGRKRKYEMSHYQKWLTENPQRLYARVKYRPKYLG